MKHPNNLCRSRRVIALALAVTILGAAVGAAFFVPQAEAGSDPGHGNPNCVKTTPVQPRETLWSIASDVAMNFDEIRALNPNLGEHIEPGWRVCISQVRNQDVNGTVVLSTRESAAKNTRYTVTVVGDNATWYNVAGQTFRKTGTRVTVRLNGAGRAYKIK